ncbi:MAG: transcription antitermination factor NusB [Firmicutes bacterium]|nr:transcription antitermination factor NusB [Bacillota bacterium]
MQRRKAREAALQALFQIDVVQAGGDEAVNYALTMHDLDKAGEAFCRALVDGVIANRSEIDQTISSWAANWHLDRLANVERNILRIAFYELLYRTDIPEGVAISEAVEVAKDFGDDNSGRFVNGILGEFSRSRHK